MTFCNNCHRDIERPPGKIVLLQGDDQRFVFCSAICHEQFEQEKQRYRSNKADEERYHRFWKGIGQLIMKMEDEDPRLGEDPTSLVLTSTMLRAYADLLDAFLRETNPDLDSSIFPTIANFTKILGERVTVAYFDSVDEQLLRRWRSRKRGKDK